MSIIYGYTTANTKNRKDNTMKKITIFLLVLTLLIATCLSGFTVMANEKMKPQPRLAHIANADFYFAASSDGCDMSVYYTGYNSFARADLSIRVEVKGVLGIWQEIFVWNASSTNSTDTFSCNCSADRHSKYRATFTLTVTGTDGSTDVISETLSDVY